MVEILDCGMKKVHFKKDHIFMLVAQGGKFTLFAMPTKLLIHYEYKTVTKK